MLDKDLEGNQAMFAEMIWDCEPISSGDLVKKGQLMFNWKKSTTYTVLKILCEKGLFRNTDGIVSSVVSREQYYANKSRKIVDENFQGSLPMFIAAFASGRKLSAAEIEEIQQMIDDYRKEEG